MIETAVLKRASILFSLVFSLLTASAQWDNRVFHWQHHVQSDDSGKLSLGMYHLGYARNTEYANLLKKGRTVLGYQWMPTLAYQPTAHTKLTLGVFFQQDFGSTKPFSLAPVYQFTFHKHAHTFHFGTLDGNLQHRLIEPLYDFERAITQPLENGLQYRFEGKHFYSDIWIDWRRMIYPGSTFSELFTSGASASLIVFQNKNWDLTLPAQGMVTHRGGEIDQSGEPVLSLYNCAAGGELKYRPTKGKLQSVSAQVMGTYYLDASNTIHETFIDGNGSYATLNAKWRYLNIMLNYWDAYQFQSSLGDPVFHSTSRKNPNRIFFSRRLVMSRIGYEKAINPHLSLVGRLQILYDPDLSTTDHITEFYIRYRRSVGLGSI